MTDKKNRTCPFDGQFLKEIGRGKYFCGHCGKEFLALGWKTIGMGVPQPRYRYDKQHHYNRFQSGKNRN